MRLLKNSNYKEPKKDISSVNNINKKFEVIINYNNEHAKNVAYRELYHLLKEYGLNKKNIRIIEIKIQNNWKRDFWNVSMTSSPY